MSNNFRSNLNNANVVSGHTGFTPVGSLIFYDGLTPPDNYLVCDGTVYNIADYPELANHYETQYGSKNAFGGDGVTTFAVRDLQGEFLRAAGTNSHANQGNGANNMQNADSRYGETTGRAIVSQDRGDDYSGNPANNSVRPTNTSVLFCIAYKDIYIDYALDGFPVAVTNPQDKQGLTFDAATQKWVNGAVGLHEYSTTEKVVGTWLDGRPVYERTLLNTNEIVFSNKDRRWIDIATVADVDRIISMKGNVGLALTSNPNVVYMYKDIPYADNLYSYEISLAYDTSNSKLKLLERGIVDEKIIVGNLLVIFRYIKTTDTPTV